jgi:3D (Asp-Asp-Asp) domain-containing protein
LDTPIAPGLVVRVTRVREETLTESEFIAFKTIHQPDRNLELDQQRIVTPGKQGVRKRTINVRFENNKEVQRTLEREWIDEEPATQVVAYGTRVVVRTLNTPQGPVDYWRELRVWATYYTAATSGKGRDHPQYGITRTGLTATKGVIAVDPIAIRLHTPMYVPGYGFGKAEDTGGLILGMHIDLCFDEHDPNPQHMGWVTAYLLTPVPSDIPYLLPDYPRERR